MKSIGAITGNLRQNQTGMATYAFHILNGIKTEYQVNQISDKSGEILHGCQNVSPKTLPIPYHYLIWSISTSIQKRFFSQFDIIHNMCQYPIIPPRDKKSIITIYDLIPVLYPDLVTPIYAWQSRTFLPRILKRTNRILTISNHTKNDLIERYHINPDRIDVTPLGVSNHFKPYDFEKVSKFKEKYNLLSPYVLFVGALEPKKNITGIIKAFSLCLKQKPKLNLVLAGKPSWKFQEIYSLILTLNLKNNVRVLNFIPYQDLPLLYTGAEVFVFPSRYEGFGLPPLEAMKCGTPVIVSDKSSLPEIVGEKGLMVNPDDIQGLSNLILRVVEEPDFRNEMREYYLKRADIFTWKRCIDGTIQSYEKALSE